MSDDPIDPERLKELIGAPHRGSGPVREIASAGGADRSLEDLARVAVAEIQAQKGPRRKYSTDERPPAVVIRRSRVGTVVLGLLIVVAVFVGRRTFQAPPPPIPGDPFDLVAVLSPGARISAALSPEWSAARTDTGSLSERERAVRIGALIVEMERAVARDDSTAHIYADAIAALVAEIPDGAEVAGLFAAVDEARLPSSRHALAAFVRAAPMGVGAWLQGARVAAAASDAGFFASLMSRESLRLLQTFSDVSPEVQTARDRLDAVLRRRGRPDFVAAGGALEVLQRELAN